MGPLAALFARPSPVLPTRQQQRERRERADRSAEAATASRPVIAWPSARDAFNAVLAVEQMMQTGGGWQDQVGGALEGMRLTTASPGDSGNALGLGSLPDYTVRIAALPPAAAAFLSRHVACVFTGACRLAATVARGVVDAWQRRAPGVEASLRLCAAISREMTDCLDRLGALPPASFTGVGSLAAQAELAAFGAALERHKAIQEQLWPATSSPVVVALYRAVARLSVGSHICGAGNGGHIVVFLKPGWTPAAVAAAVAACNAAPDAKVVRVQMMLGGGGGGGGGSGGGGAGAGEGPRIGNNNNTANSNGGERARQQLEPGPDGKRQRIG
jgi:fucokinase